MRRTLRVFRMIGIFGVRIGPPVFRIIRAGARKGIGHVHPEHAPRDVAPLSVGGPHHLDADHLGAGHQAPLPVALDQAVGDGAAEGLARPLGGRAVVVLVLGVLAPVL